MMRDADEKGLEGGEDTLEAEMIELLASASDGDEGPLVPAAAVCLSSSPS